MQDITVALVQTELFWEDKAANFSILEKKIASLNQPVDIVLLPETFSTGFSMNPGDLAEPMDGRTMQWLQNQAKKINAIIGCSLIIEENQNYYNRFIWMEPSGQIQYYDKRHLFSLANEDKVFSKGEKHLVVELNGWRILPLICYDLRFPVWARNTPNLAYDLLIYVANWPDKRIHAWKTLLRARAIENQAYTVGVNRIGEDGNGLVYTGASMIIDYAGEIIFGGQEDEMMHIEVLSKPKQDEFKKKLAFLNDQDSFDLLLS